MAGNQLGKTLAGGFEAAMHATGRYPDGWNGKRFDRPTVGWACGVTGEVVRDTVQKILVGPMPLPNWALLASFPSCWTQSRSSMCPVVTQSSVSKPTLPVVKNSRGKLLIGFGLMKNRPQTSTPKDSRAPMSALIRCG